MVNPTNFRFTPFSTPIENAEFNFSNMYLHQFYDGANANQSLVAAGDAKTKFGRTAVNNWAIYEGIGPDARLLAHAKGMHMNTSDWYNSFTMVFDGERSVVSSILYTCKDDYIIWK